MNHYLHMSFMCNTHCVLPIFMQNIDQRPTHSVAIQYASPAMVSRFIYTLFYTKITSKTTIVGKKYHIFIFFTPKRKKNQRKILPAPSGYMFHSFKKRKRKNKNENEKQLLFVSLDSIFFVCCVFGCNCRLLYLFGICIQYVSVKILVKHEQWC